MPSNALAGATSELTASLDEFLDIILGVLLPIALALIGFFVLAPVVGLSGFFATFMTGVSLGPTLQTGIAVGAAVLVEGGLGFGLVAVERMHDGWTGDVVGSIGWMSVAMALREGVNFLMNQTTLAPSAALASVASKLQAGVSNLATGN